MIFYNYLMNYELDHSSFRNTTLKEAHKLIKDSITYKDNFSSSLRLKKS